MNELKVSLGLLTFFALVEVSYQQTQEGSPDRWVEIPSLTLYCQLLSPNCWQRQKKKKRNHIIAINQTGCLK